MSSYCKLQGTDAKKNIIKSEVTKNPYDIWGFFPLGWMQTKKPQDTVCLNNRNW